MAFLLLSSQSVRMSYNNRYMRCYCLWAVLFLLSLTASARVRITVFHPDSEQRQEVVEVEAQALRKALAIGESSPFVLKNATGQQQGYQITHDGKLLFFASVRPKQSWTVYAEIGQPQNFKVWTRGSLYKIRKDDIAWENDRCAYRVYGPALQATGEKAFGIDVWVKNTSDLVLDYRYARDHRGNVVADSLRRLGLRAAADSAVQAMTFHLDHGYGMDGYGVGPTLGCGTPALMEGGRLILLYCYKSYQILDNGPLRFTVKLDFAANADGIVEHRIISLDRGSHFNKITVWYDHLTRPMTFCAGIVLNGNGDPWFGENFTAYADPTDRPDVHGSEIYVAALFPYHKVVMGKTPDGKNAVGMIKNYKGEKVTYFAGAAWSLYDIPNFTVWKEIVRSCMECYSDRQRMLRESITVE